MTGFIVILFGTILVVFHFKERNSLVAKDIPQAMTLMDEWNKNGRLFCKMTTRHGWELAWYIERTHLLHSVPLGARMSQNVPKSMENILQPEHWMRFSREYNQVCREFELYEKRSNICCAIYSCICCLVCTNIFFTCWPYLIDHVETPLIHQRLAKTFQEQWSSIVKDWNDCHANTGVV